MRLKFSTNTTFHVEHGVEPSKYFRYTFHVEQNVDMWMDFVGNFDVPRGTFNKQQK